MIPKLTQEQAIILTGFTGMLCCSDMGAFHAEVEKRMGRSVFTHELGRQYIVDEIKELFRADFLAMVPEK